MIKWKLLDLNHLLRAKICIGNELYVLLYVHIVTFTHDKIMLNVPFQTAS